MVLKSSGSSAAASSAIPVGRSGLTGRGPEGLGAAHDDHVVVIGRHHVVVRIVDIEAFADALPDGFGHFAGALPRVAHRREPHLLLVGLQFRMRDLQDRDVRNPQGVERLPDFRHLGRGAQLQLVLGRGHRGVLLEEFAREVGHLELLLDIDAQLPERGDHVALLALDRNPALRVALVDDHLKVELVGSDLLLGPAVHLDIAGVRLLHLRHRGERHQGGHRQYDQSFHSFSSFRFSENSFANKTPEPEGYCIRGGAFHPPIRPFRPGGQRRTSLTTFSTWCVWGNISTGCTASTR